MSDKDWKVLRPNQTLILRPMPEADDSGEQRSTLPQVKYIYTAVDGAIHSDHMVGGLYSQVAFSMHRNTWPEEDYFTVTYVAGDSAAMQTVYKVPHGKFVHLEVDWKQIAYEHVPIADDGQSRDGISVTATSITNDPSTAADSM